ncbi:hypothetical protein LR48_Vigan07g212300 [Vigna angularis]|uniref:Wall-associated receptor kinase galacturonan-binding domain-containing protein n=1 Tax=Phaseolus angularis TaxID=3914 RepID=A0A0L9V0Y8_PHAAN|nr:hypothetical protein LR48_Vigan07g212300 [Vigna angularis]
MHTATMKRRVRIPIVVILLLIQTCAAALSSNCPASSCGNIPNISYPFRLGGDPSHCGDTRYQLQCENNATLLTLFSGKYRVQEIDYKRYKIRVSDAEDGTCSSMPRYFLQSGNFSNDLIGPGRDLLKLEPFFQPSIAYFNCSYPIADDPRYVAVEASGCDLRGHVYAFVRDSQNGFGVKDIKVGCQLVVATFAGVGEHKSNEAISYSEIYKMLSQGFELSWLYLICENRCGKGVDCSVDESTNEVRCQQDCRYIYEEPNSVTYECSSGSNANIIYVIAPTLWYLEQGYRRTCVEGSITESVCMAAMGVIPRSLPVFDEQGYEDWCVKLEAIFGFRKVDEIVIDFQEPAKNASDDQKQTYKMNKRLDCKVLLMLIPCLGWKALSHLSFFVHFPISLLSVQLNLSCSSEASSFFLLPLSLSVNQILGLCVSSRSTTSRRREGRHYARRGEGVLQRWCFREGSIFDVFAMREALFDGDVVEEKSWIAFAVWWPPVSGSFAVTGLVSEGSDLGLCKNSSSFPKISSGSPSFGLSRGGGCTSGGNGGAGRCDMDVTVVGRGIFRGLDLIWAGLIVP